jgi:predicted  nucleic acid-binding Zn-ribbon protein
VWYYKIQLIGEYGMTLRDMRKFSVDKMDAEIARLEGRLQKMRKDHDVLQQTLFDVCKKLNEAPDSHTLIKHTEDLKKKISDSMTDIHHLDARISKVKHRADRLRLHH